MSAGESGLDWPRDKLTALQQGRRLVAEVSASRAGRRAFVDISPSGLAPRVRASVGQVSAFRVEHWEYDAGRVEGWDYDIGAVLVRSAEVAGHAELMNVVLGWHIRPDRFDYPWNTDDPR